MSKQRPPGQVVNELLQRGYQLHQQGQLDLAADLYRDVLRLHARNFDALHLLGMLSLQTNDATSAIEWLRKAIDVNPAEPATYSLRGVALQKAGRTDEALSSFDRAIRLSPSTAEYHYNRGKLLRELDRLDDALINYDHAIALNKNDPFAWNNRSEILLALERHEDSLASANRALAIKADYAEAMCNKGIALQALDRPEEALQSLNAALELKPNLPNGLFHRGNVFTVVEKHKDALADYERALSLRPNTADYIRGKSNSLRQLGRFEEALNCINELSNTPDNAETLHQCGLIQYDMRRLAEALDYFDRAIKLKPHFADALINRGNTLMQMNKPIEALDSYRLAAQLAPKKRVSHWNLCLCQLLLGNFKDGWSEYQWRWSNQLKDLRPSINKPVWNGENLDGTLLIWGEQGLGDQLIFASMLQEVIPKVKNLVVAVDHRLHPLLSRSLPEITFTTIEQALSTGQFEAHLAIGDLGQYFRPNLQSFFTHRTAYLRAESSRAVMLRKQLLTEPSTKICGISWLSNNKIIGREKSMSLRDLLPLLSMPGYSFIDLQYGDTSAEREELHRDTGLEVIRETSVDTWNDIDGLAALIEACDVIVTISNTTTHIAGALGKEVYLMLPYSQGLFWYWQTERSDTLWYPNVRVFRQPAEGDWANVIAQVCDALAARTTLTA